MTGGYCIIGCGAMGGLLALQLYRATGRPVTCIVRSGEQASILNDQGLRVIERGRSLLVPVRAYQGASPPGACERAIITVKAWDIPRALDAALESGSRAVFLLANGLTGEGEMASRGYEPRYIVSSYGALRRGPGLVEARGLGEHIVGSSRGLDVESCRLALALSLGGARAWCTGRILYYRWLKAAVNIAVNGVASLLWERNRVVSENRWARRAAERLAVEAALMAGCAGVPVDPGEAAGVALRVAAETGENVCSTLQDLEACGRTEADELFLPVIEAWRPGCPRPSSIETLYFLVKALEEGRLRCRRRRSRRGD